jgi:hypothetical protein
VADHPRRGRGVLFVQTRDVCISRTSICWRFALEPMGLRCPLGMFEGSAMSQRLIAREREQEVLLKGA